MTAKTPKARHKKFLSSGFFAPELPPCFYSSDFGKRRDFLLKRIDSVLDKKGNKAVLNYKSHKLSFNFPRFNNVDRRHSVINPISYLYISKILSDNYVTLRSSSKKRSKISVSRSIFDWTGDRALKRPLFESRDNLVNKINAQFEYIANADIQAFYHSIYTHAIPWAMHGKANAKADRTHNLYGNLIDQLSRNAQDGQTIGLPVGPDTSRMIAEVIGAAIDERINSEKKIDGSSVVRFVDDYVWGLNSRDDAESAIALIRRAANMYELDLNPVKTNIKNAGSGHENGWKSLLRSYIPKPPYKEDDIQIFLYQVESMANSLPSINVVKFALQNARRVFSESDGWLHLENFIVSRYRNNSSLIDIFVELILNRHLVKGDVSRQWIQKFIDSRLPILFEKGRSGEAIWLTFLAIHLGLSLKADGLQPFLDGCDPLVGVLIADLSSRGLVSRKPNFAKLNTFCNKEDLDSEMWLYAYEVGLKSMAGIKSASYISDHKYFSHFLEKKIEFYRTNSGVGAMADFFKIRRHENSLSKILNHKMSLDIDFDWDEEEEIDDEDGSFY